MPLHDLTPVITPGTGTAYDDTALKAKNAAQDNAITDLKLADATADAALKVLGKKIDDLPKSPDLTPLTERVAKSELDITDLTTKLKTANDTVAAQDIAIKALTGRGIIVRSKLKPDSVPDATLWDLWIENQEDIANKKLTVRFWVRVAPGVAMPVLVVPGVLELPAHGNAVQVSPGMYRNELSQSVVINYTIKPDMQNQGVFDIKFPAGVVKKIAWESRTAAATPIDSGTRDIDATAAGASLSLFYGDGSIVDTLWAFTFVDNSIQEYLQPVAR